MTVYEMEKVAEELHKLAAFFQQSAVHEMSKHRNKERRTGDQE